MLTWDTIGPCVIGSLCDEVKGAILIALQMNNRLGDHGMLKHKSILTDVCNLCAYFHSMTGALNKTNFPFL